MPVYYLKSAIFVTQKGGDESSNQQHPSELSRAPAQKAMPVFDFLCSDRVYSRDSHENLIECLRLRAVSDTRVDIAKKTGPIRKAGITASHQPVFYLQHDARQDQHSYTLCW